MNKTIQRILVILALICLIIFGLYYDAFYRAPDRLSIRYENVTNYKISSKLNGFSICFFSDLHFSNENDKNRISNCVAKINEQNPDVVVFLGDLIDKNNTLSIDSTKQYLIECFSKINAPYGKFAINGECDLLNDNSKAYYQEILSESGFEILNNTNLKLSQKNRDYINLIALDSQDGGQIDTEKAFESVNDSVYSLVICHTPDTFEELKSYNFDLMVSGHTLGGQVNLFTPLYSFNYGKKYISGKYYFDNKTLDVTNGIGTIEKDVRLFAPSEIVIYHLYHE